MTVTKLKDFDYEVIDPVSKGRWVVTSHISLSDIGVIYSIMNVILNEDKRPKEGSTITVVFSFTIEGNDNQKSKGQKFFETLVQ